MYVLIFINIISSIAFKSKIINMNKRQKQKNKDKKGLAKSKPSLEFLEESQKKGNFYFLEESYLYVKN